MNFPLNAEALLACCGLRVAAMSMMCYFVDWRPHPSVKISYLLQLRQHYPEAQLSEFPILCKGLASLWPPGNNHEYDVIFCKNLISS